MIFIKTLERSLQCQGFVRVRGKDVTMCKIRNKSKDEGYHEILQIIKEYEMLSTIHNFFHGRSMTFIKCKNINCHKLQCVTL